MEATPFHIGITTGNLPTAREKLSATFGYTWTEPAGADQTMYTVDGKPQLRPVSCISRQGPIHIDLIEGAPGTIWATTETRIHHFAYWTDQLRTDIAALVEDGWRLEMTRPDAAGNPTVFAYLIKADGLRLELIDDAGRDGYYAALQA